MKDSSGFTILCTIGNLIFENALCDLDASINLMPLSIFKNLGFGEVMPTIIFLQITNRSLTYPWGIIEDM